MYRFLTRSLPRKSCSRNWKRGILTPAFALNQEWNERHSDISRLGLGGEYEWIATVQKKFIGGGYATPVDVDVAVCMGEEKDQVEDVLDIVRKLRHSPLASRVAPSSQYAILRLLLKHNPKEIIRLANDTINNGIFADEHSACLILNNLIEKEEWKDAARISGWMTHQEEYESELLKTLCLYSSLRWAELSFEERMEEKEEEEEINDDDIVTIKMAFLKKEYNDCHLDVVDLPSLTAKTMLWLSREMNIDLSLKRCIESVSNVIGGKSVPSIDTISPSAALLIHSYLSTLPDQSEEINEYIEKVKVVGEKEKDVESLSSKVLSYLKNIQKKEEKILMEKQVKKFEQWNERRRNLIEVQTKRLQLKVLRCEMEKELSELEEEEQRLFFFENRLLLEKSARENAEIANENYLHK
uniref:Uncharacterized protein n=1 Tax=Pristionchus pacificus TaxID=54126 RepID=A0A8R1V4N6_PRIPA